MYNCSDDSVAAALYLTRYIESFVEPAGGLGERACGWGAFEGWCSNIVFAGLCAKSCHEFKETTIQGHRYIYQETQIPSGGGDCNGDNDLALGTFLADLTKTCSDAADGCFDDGSVSNTFPLRDIVPVLCKELCSGLAIQPSTPQVVAETDEVSPSGANFIVGERSPTNAPSAAPRLQDRARLVRASYKPYDPSELFWEPSLRAFPANSHDASLCGMAVSEPAPLETSEWYVSSMTVDPNAHLAYTCLLALCPESTVCVLSGERFEQESLNFYAPLDDPTGIVYDKSKYLFNQIGAVNSNPVKSLFVPKGLVSQDFSVAFLTGSFIYQFSASGGLFRDMMAPTRVVVHDFGPDAETTKLLLSLRSARSSALPAKWNEHMTSWKTDVVRVEIFDENGLPLSSTESVTLRIHAPRAAGLAFFVYPQDGEAKRISHESQDDWYLLEVRADAMPCDIVGAFDIDECIDDPCHNEATCVNQIGLPPLCQCAPPYIETEDVGFGSSGCILAPDLLQKNFFEQRNFITEIRPVNHLERGWWIKRIEIYSDENCKSTLRNALESQYASRHYPAPGSSVSYGVEQLRSDPSEEWRSECVRCNAIGTTLTDSDAGYSSTNWDSEPHVGLVHKRDDVYKCIRVIEAVGHSSGELQLQKFGGSKTLFEGDGSRKTVTLTSRRTPTTIDTEKQEVITDFPISCGMRGVKLLGEAPECGQGLSMLSRF